MVVQKGFETLISWWKVFKTVFIAVGVLLSFFAVVELLRAYQTLRDIHPIAGIAFIGIVACGLLCAVGYIMISLGSRPPVLTVPAVADPDNPSGREVRRYGSYLTRYIARLSKNDNLPGEDKDKAQEGMERLATALRAGGGREQPLGAVEQAENETIEPLLAKLDEQAEREIRNCTRDVMAAVAFSPYQAIDLMIVLFRNLAMVIRIVHIYNSRPRLKEQLRILADTIAVVATVNYLNMGKSLLEDLGSRVPGIGKSLDDIAQGVGAGFMTSVAGHAAKHRCRAFRKWDAQEAKESLRRHVHEFYADVKDMFWKDVLPGIKGRLGDITRNQWGKVTSGISSALDETGRAIGRFMRDPLATGSGGGASAEVRRGRAVIKSAVGVCSTAGEKAREMGAGVFRESKSAGSKGLARLGKSKQKADEDRPGSD
jgi:putative membrane protein